MASIEHRGDRVFVRWREDGVRYNRPCPDTKTAERLKAEIDRAHALGQRWEPETARRLADLEEVADAYVRHCARSKAPRTAQLYGERLDVFRRWLESTDARRRRWTIDVLSRELLERFWDHLASTPSRNGRMRTKSTVRKVVFDVETWWKWAYSRDEDFHGVPRPKRMTDDIERPRPPVAVAPTWEEMDAAIDCADGWLQRVMVVLRFTGLRDDTQAMQLRWDDVDLDRAELTIRPELGKTAAERRGRTMPISRHLVAELAGWGRRDGWLIESPREHRDGSENRCVRGRDLQRAWQRAGVRESVWRKRPGHAFRKGFESGLLGLGAAYPRVEWLVGHTLPGQGDAYVDPTIALELRAVVDLVPPLGGEQVVTVNFERERR